MTLDANRFQALFQQLLSIDLFGTAPPPPPFKRPTVPAVQKAIAGGAKLLPPAFREGYAAPLLTNLSHVLAALQGDFTTIEALAGAIYQHAQATGKPELHRFLAVISDLYRSFLSKKRRTQADFPIVETLPPLALFQHAGDNGPFTLPSDDIQQLFSATVGVVSLPATYRDHPVLWASLAHETGGHDVIHADAGLLPELKAGVRAQLGAPTTVPPNNVIPKQLIGLLWDYWMDEAASDVYGVLNIGPSFGPNLAVFFATLNAEGTKTQVPRLRTQSGFDPRDPQKALDPHPTDILRLSLVQGVVESLQGLSQTSRAAYSDDLAALAKILAPDATSVDIAGYLLLGPGVRIPVQESVPLADMQKVARQVGAYIATARLEALSNHSIQDIETWDDPDEQTAQQISEGMKNNQSVAGLGDDAQLLAGVTLALLDRPNLYAQVSQRLEEALDLSFSRDPFWTKPQPEPVFLRSISLEFGTSHPAQPPRARRAKA